MIGEAWTRLRYLFSRRNTAETDSELRFHLEQSMERNRAAGMSEHEARRQALVELGGVERTREQCYEQRPGWWMASVMPRMFAMRCAASGATGCLPPL